MECKRNVYRVIFLDNLMYSFVTDRGISVEDETIGLIVENEGISPGLGSAVLNILILAVEVEWVRI